MFNFFFNGEKVAAVTLANYILARVQEPINNMKLQKILYYIQGHFSAAFGRPLFPDEIHAWKFGPVVPSVYYTFSYYGSESLYPSEHNAAEVVHASCNPVEIDLIDRVIGQKAPLTARQLIADTRSESPWLEATDGGREIHMNNVIPVKGIMEFFSGIHSK